VATVERSLSVDRRRAVLRPEVPAGGELELLRLDAALERLPEIYAGLTFLRPGMMTRPPYWWPGLERHLRRSDNPTTTIVHHGPDGPDGYLVYQVDRKNWTEPSTLDASS
jgi:predicted acetyltransferase